MTAAYTAIVLVGTFGSPVAAGMTLLNALVGVGVGMAGPYALTDVFSLNDATPVLALMPGLAVGIDSLSMLPLPAAPPRRPGPPGGGRIRHRHRRVGGRVRRRARGHRRGLRR
ncbi:MMPL family transporter [Actinomadura citrea]|nr:MMPL family transporter [Actinomadura citrea]